MATKCSGNGALRKGVSILPLAARHARGTPASLSQGECSSVVARSQPQVSRHVSSFDGLLEPLFLPGRVVFFRALFLITPFRR